MTSRSATRRFRAWPRFHERELTPFRPLLQHRRLDEKPPVQGLLERDSRSGSHSNVHCSDDGETLGGGCAPAGGCGATRECSGVGGPDGDPTGVLCWTSEWGQTVRGGHGRDRWGEWMGLGAARRTRSSPSTVSVRWVRLGPTRPPRRTRRKEPRRLPLPCLRGQAMGGRPVRPTSLGDAGARGKMYTVVVTTLVPGRKKHSTTPATTKGC